MKCALSTLAVALLGVFSVSIVNVDARDTFVPKVSVKRNLEGFKNKKQAQASTNVHALDDKNALLSQTLPETSRNARGGSIAIADSATLSLTYYADIIWSVATLVFVIFWARSKMQFEADYDYKDKFPNFNKMVLKDGFCINPTPKGPLGTLKICGIADALLIIGSYLTHKDKFDIGNNKMNFLFCAGYTVLHGAIHFFEVDQSGKMWSPDNTMFSNVLNMGLLAAITLLAPVAITATFDEAEKPGGLAVGVAAWVAFVLYYVFGIKEKVYALTYINATIFLSLFVSRLFLFKKDDEKRLRFYVGPSVLKTILAISANIAVMCIEPLLCKDWFKSVGGHVWFDVTLWFLFMNVLAIGQ